MTRLKSRNDRFWLDLNPYIWDIEDCFYMSLELTTVGC